jgi:hypothetical protein
MRFLGYRDYASHVTDRQHGVRYGGGLVLILLSSHTCFLYASHCLPGHFVLDTAFGNDFWKNSRRLPELSNQVLLIKIDDTATLQMTVID